MLSSIRTTGPWLRFFSIMAFIGVGFMLLAGSIMLVGGVVGATFGEELGGGFMLAGMSIFYYVFAVLYIIPAVYLFRAAGGVVQIKRGELQAGMEKALANQKSFWKFAGILTLVMLCLYPIIMCVVMIVTIATHN
jgi:hypothetical protein